MSAHLHGLASLLKTKHVAVVALHLYLDRFFTPSVQPIILRIRVISCALNLKSRKQDASLKMLRLKEESEMCLVRILILAMSLR